MLSPEERAAAVEEMTLGMPGLANVGETGLQGVQGKQIDGKGTADIKGIIESFFSGNVFVVPKVKKTAVISDAERSAIAESVVAGLANITWRK